ncbi:MAG: ATPase, T2SS/T4P/T4SS family, partial [Pseudomonadota bacterium]|nr:ATPase, T2SS/T4P/T4SS family [Pseudomonadota bacterium]
TVSLYTGINILNDTSRNISTAEDPVEINLPGINQVNINLKQGLDFPRVLRSFLRQDPDIILVGEIRDLDTAEIAVKASQTGHLVLSTLHTNSASETLTRLNNMGVPLYNIATSVNLIIAQRLTRRLCEACKEPITLSKQAIAEMGYAVEGLADTVTVYEPKGCPSCNKGYKGRCGIYEVVAVNEEISKIILNGANAIELSETFRRQGYPDLFQSGLKKVLDGVTSLEEVQRVTSSH